MLFIVLIEHAKIMLWNANWTFVDWISFTDKKNTSTEQQKKCFIFWTVGTYLNKLFYIVYALKNFIILANSSFFLHPHICYLPFSFSQMQVLFNYHFVSFSCMKSTCYSVLLRKVFRLSLFFLNNLQKN